MMVKLSPLGDLLGMDKVLEASIIGIGINLGNKKGGLEKILSTKYAPFI